MQSYRAWSILLINERIPFLEICRYIFYDLTVYEVSLWLTAMGTEENPKRFFFCRGDIP